MSQVRQLYRLQQLDNDITQKKRRLTEVVQLQRETQVLQGARNNAHSASMEVARLRAEQTDLNIEVRGVVDKARSSEQRLYSGKISNPKELEDLQHEVQALGRRRSVLEDRLLEVMIDLEDALETDTGAQENLAAVERDWQSAQESLQEEQNSLALELHKLLTTRGSQVERIDKPLMAQYDLIRARKNVAVVGLSDSTCLGCHVTVSGQTLRRAQNGEAVTCSGCGRILFPI